MLSHKHFIMFGCLFVNYRNDVRQAVENWNRQVSHGQQSKGHEFLFPPHTTSRLLRSLVPVLLVVCNYLCNAVCVVSDVACSIGFGISGSVNPMWSHHRS